jgi:ribosomal protein L37E
MPKNKKNHLTCSSCNKKIIENSKFCSYCGVKVITHKSWTDKLANEIIKIVDDIEYESKILKILGFNTKITKKMRIDSLIWRMFAVNLVIQEKTNDQELNDLFHHAIAKKMFKTEKEIENFFSTIKTRYTIYHNDFNSESEQKMFNLAMDFLDFFIFGKIGNNKYPKMDKIIPISTMVTQNFSDFMIFLREKYFKD